MKDLITCIAKAIVDNPEEVVVTEIKGARSSVIELKVAKEDIGKIIGKHGRPVDHYPRSLLAFFTHQYAPYKPANYWWKKNREISLLIAALLLLLI